MLVDSSGMAPFPTTVATDDSRGKYLKDVTLKEWLLYLSHALHNYLGEASPSLILRSEGVFYYKGAIVIHTDLAAFGGDRAAFSYGGVICIDDYYTDNELGLATLNHEYGHYIHMKQVGLPVYTVTAALPSLAGAIIADPNGSAFQKFLNKYYHSQPWERVAEILGQVSYSEREYLNGSSQAALLYWLFTVTCGGALT